MTDHRPRLHRDPPTSPPHLVDDGYLVELEPVDQRVPEWWGWESARDRWARAGDRPAPLGCVHFGLGLCIGILLAALVLVGSSIAAPSSAPDPTTTSPVVDVRPGPASPSASVTGASGQELSGAPHVRGALHPGDGRQDGFSARGLDCQASMTGGAP